MNIYGYLCSQRWLSDAECRCPLQHDALRCHQVPQDTATAVTSAVADDDDDDDVDDASFNSSQIDFEVCNT